MHVYVAQTDGLTAVIPSATLYGMPGSLSDGRVDVGREVRSGAHSWLRNLSSCFKVSDKSRSPGIKNGERAMVANVFVTDRWDALLWYVRTLEAGNREFPGSE